MKLEYSIPGRFGIGAGLLLNMITLGAVNLRAPNVIVDTTAALALLLTGFGCVNYARAKGHDPRWGLLGLVPPAGAPGLVVVCLMQDRASDPPRDDETVDKE